MNVDGSGEVNVKKGLEGSPLCQFLSLGSPIIRLKFRRN